MRAGIAKDGKGDKEVAMIYRVESAWVRTPDALSKQARRERRRQQEKDQHQPGEEPGEGQPAEEKLTLDLVA